MTVTVRGKTFAAKLVASLEILNELMVVYEDERPFSAIAADWEDADSITAVDALGKETTYSGYTIMKRIVREEGNAIQIAFAKG